jgi:beta-barrel assembly-enhancing protease
MAVFAATIFSALMLSSCATLGLGGGNINLVSLDEEWRMGEQIEQDLARQLTLVNDREALAYLNQMGQRMVSQTSLADRPWKFRIVADPSINAFNVPGGLVYVNTGLIGAAANASELAGVVAHEVAHGVARHGTQRLTKAYGFNLVAALLLGQNPALYQQIVAQIVAGGAFASFSRSDEREADRLGVRYMADAGYHPDGMAAMFQKLMGERGRRPGAVEQFFASHPLTEDRIRDVRREAERVPRPSSLMTNEAGFDQMKSRLSRYNR